MVAMTKGLIVAAAAFGGLALQSVGASAMPMVDIGPAVAAHADAASGVQEARWVCGPFRCFWRPNYYGYGYYRPRPFFGGYGWHRHYGWGGGWHGGWHRWHHWR